MTYYYDDHGWATANPIANRATDQVPPADSGGFKANWNGVAWVLQSYVAPSLPTTAVSQCDGFTFYRKMTATERIAIRALASTDPIANDFLHTLDSAIASNTPIWSNDPDLIAAMGYLSAHPSVNPCLGAGRATALLT